MISIIEVLLIIAGLTALGVGADVVLNYEIKSEQVTATNAIVATSTTAINAITATTQTAVGAILNASELHDVYSVTKEKINAQVTDIKAQQSQQTATK